MIRLGKHAAQHKAAAHWTALKPLLVSLTALTALSACETLPFGPSMTNDSVQTGDGANATITDPPAPVPPPPRPQPAKNTAIAKVDSVSAETPLPIEKPPVTSLSENEIVGAESQKVRMLIGQPESVVTNAPSQTWFYASGPCRFSVQFFKDLDSGQYRALKYTVDGGTLERCLAQFEHLNAAAPIEAQSEINDMKAQTTPSSG